LEKKTAMSESVNITSLQEGDQGVIHAIEGGSAITSRFAGMGIVSNARFRIAQISGGLIVLQVANTRIALGRGEASKITVSKVAPEADVCMPPIEKEISVALVGQPNVGKSTVFNILTGLSQHVGNWPGKTVEKKEGTHRADSVLIRIVDLPGTYSLTAFSEEERITRDFIIKEQPGLVVLVLNATALERGLYLLAEVLLLNRPVIVVLNMLDVAADQDIEINIRALEDSLGVPVIPMVAKRNSGIRELVSHISSIASSEYKFQPVKPEVSTDHQLIYQQILTLVRPYIHDPYTPEWVAVKLMEGDPEVTQLVEQQVQTIARDGLNLLFDKLGNFRVAFHQFHRHPFGCVRIMDIGSDQRQDLLIDQLMIGGYFRLYRLKFVFTGRNRGDMRNKFPDAAVAFGHHGNHRYAQRIFQCPDVDFNILIGSNIKHIEDHDDRPIEQQHFGQKIKTPLQSRCVQDQHNQPGLLLDDEITRNSFFFGKCRQTVSPGQINNSDQNAVGTMGPFFFFNRFSRPVADMLG